MQCLYANKTNTRKCNCLKEKNCNSCKFYKQATEEYYLKYIIQAEKDIAFYSQNKNSNMEGA